MNNTQFFIYLILMAGVTYLIRALPFAAITKKIQSPFIRSFLYYIPVTVLTVMTIPSAFFVTGHILSAVVGIVGAVLVSIRYKNLTLTAATACVLVYITEILTSIL